MEDDAGMEQVARRSGRGIKNYDIYEFLWQLDIKGLEGYGPDASKWD